MPHHSEMAGIGHPLFQGDRTERVTVGLLVEEVGGLCYVSITGAKGQRGHYTWASAKQLEQLAAALERAARAMRGRRILT